jgi:hypothetical protein
MAQAGEIFLDLVSGSVKNGTAFRQSPAARGF